MGKKENLLNQLGNNMGESVGRRTAVHGEPIARPVETAGKHKGRTRSRQSGDLELTQIIADPEQPRKQFDEAALQELADSIRKNGVLQPITVRWVEDIKKWQIVYGERRYRAAQQAGLSSVPCVFEEGELPESSVRVRQLVENCVREDLEPTQVALALKSLQELTDWSTQELASEIGLSKAKVVRSLALLKLPKDVRDDVDRGELAPTVASAIARIEGAKRQRKVAKDVIKQDLNRKEALELVTATLESSKPIQASTVSVENTSRDTINEQGTFRRFETRHSVITIEHKKPNASLADLQEALLAVVKQLGKAHSKRR